MSVSIAELQRIVGGCLRQGAMPPRHGDCSALGRIVTDSRAIEPGDVFWAIPGRKHNGSHFAEDALSRGASGVVTSGRWVAPWAGCWSLEVADSTAALWTLAHWTCNRFTGRVIAIDGAMGTSTALRMIDTLVHTAAQGRSIEIERNGKAVDSARALAQIPLHDDYVLIETNRTIELETARVDRVNKPDIAVFMHSGWTGAADSDRFVDTSAIERLRAAGTAGVRVVVNGDDPHLRRAAGKSSQAIVVGRSSDAHITACRVAYSAGVLSFTIDQNQFRVRSRGRHELIAALVAVAVGRCFNMTDADIVEGFRDYQPAERECLADCAIKATSLEDAQLSSPAITHAALDSLNACGKTRALVCGDSEASRISDAMLDLLGELCVTRAGADLLVACGPCASKLSTAANEAGLPRHLAVECETVDQAADELRTRLQPHDAVLTIGLGSKALKQSLRQPQSIAYRRAA